MSADLQPLFGLATQAIREEERFKNNNSNGKANFCPIVALSASVMQEHINYCMEIGMNDYMSKPVVKRIFEEKLVRWIPEL